MRGGAGAGRSLSHGPRYFLRSALRGCAPELKISLNRILAKRLKMLSHHSLAEIIRNILKVLSRVSDINLP